MRIFKRVEELEKSVLKQYEHISKLTSSYVKMLNTMEGLNGTFGLLIDENKKLKERISDLEKKMPDYEEAVSKGVERRWDEAVQAVADFNPYAEFNKPGVKE